MCIGEREGGREGGRERGGGERQRSSGMGMVNSAGN